MRLPVLLLWICVTFTQCVLAAEPVPRMQCEPPGTTLATCDSANALRCPAPTSLVTRAASKRAALVAAAVSAPGPAAPLDNTVKFVSDNATLDLNGNTTLSGNVRIQQGDREIRADNVEYRADNNAFHVKGSVEYRDPVIRARGGEGQYSQTGGATFKGAEFELPERPARGSARDMRLDPNGVVTLDAVSFSTCPAAKPDWRIRAKSIQLDTRGRSGSGRNAEIEFKGVPILYLPYITFPLGQQRKSGVLFPNFGNTTRSGVEIAVPYYWNIAPSMDMTLQPTLYGKRGFDLQSEYRYLGRNYHGSAEVDFLPSDRVAHSNRGRVRVKHVSELPAGWRLNVQAEQVSDPEYYEDFAQGPESTSVGFAEQLATLSYRDAHWRLQGEIQHFQNVDRALALADRPYAVLPRLLASGNWSARSLPAFRYGFDAELTNFDRVSGVTGWRFDATPQVGLDISRTGYFLRPTVGFRTTRYQLQHTAPGTRSSSSRSLPFAALDAGLLFERASGGAGQRRVTLEPRLLYLNTPYRDQSALPLFDTALPDLNLVQLFRTNRYVGADRVGDANQLSVGVTTRLFGARDGAQFLAATLGQTYYFKAPRVRLPEEINSNNRSDLVAQLSLTTYKHWNADLGLQWNPALAERQRMETRLQYRPDDERVVNLGYRFQRGTAGPRVTGAAPALRSKLEQAELSGAWPIGQRWNTFARIVYDLGTHQALERFAGLEYKACCWRFRLVARRFVSSRTGQRDTGVYLQLELNGLASVGTPADAFLESAIRGYSAPGAGLQ